MLIRLLVRFGINGSDGGGESDGVAWEELGGWDCMSRGRTFWLGIGYRVMAYCVF